MQNWQKKMTDLLEAFNQALTLLSRLFVCVSSTWIMTLRVIMQLLLQRREKCLNGTLPKMKKATRHPPVLDRSSNGRPWISTGEKPILNLSSIVMVEDKSC